MNLEITGLNLKISDEQKKLIDKKIGGLDKYLPRQQRQAALGEVRLEERKADQQLLINSEVTFRLPREVLVVNHADSDAFTAINETANKMKLALKKYKEKYASKKIRQRLTSRWHRG